MKPSQVRAIIIVIISGVSLLVRAQITPKPPVTVRAIVGEVSDYRSSSNSHARCAVELTLVGDNIAEATDVIRIRPTRATDDLNQDLLPRESANAGSFILSEYSSPERKETNQLSASVFLRSTTRAAKAIKVLEGEVELFVPTVANGGRIVIRNLSEGPQSPANNPSLKKLGIGVTYQTKAMFETQKRSPSPQAGFLQSQWPGSGVAARIFVHTTNPAPYRVELLTGDETKLYPKLNRFFERGVRCLELTNQSPLGNKIVITRLTPETRQIFRFKVENISIP